MRLLLVFLLLAVPLPAAVFVPPDESKTLFRRDLLPLDTDTMRALSAHLTTLARRETAGQPRQLRATAQLLAVAIRLDPANRPARELSRRLAETRNARSADREKLTRALADTWLVVDWLLQPEAGLQGQLLGHRLLDALHLIDPRHPHVRRHDAAGETARWNGIVAGLDLFERAEAPPGPGEASSDSPVPAPAAVPAPPPVKRPPVLLRQAGIRTPIFVSDHDLEPELRVVSISMEILESGSPAPLTFSLAPEVKSPALDSARQRVGRSLERTWPHLPLGTVAILRTGEQPYPSRNGTAISGPASLLLHAALTGKQLRRDVVFVGDLRGDGSLTRPRWSWDYIHALRSGAGGRLLVPPDLLADLLAMLALEDPGFFLKWEVLVVRSLDEALEFASEDDDPHLAAASRMFDDVRRVGEGNDVGQLCVNLRVRERLREIQSRAPSHLSASMLLLQGSGQRRPIRFERAVTARVLRSAVEPLAGLTRAPLSTLTARRIEAAAQSARRAVDRFPKYFQTSDSGLHQEAVDLTALALALARARQLGKADPEGSLVTPEGIALSSVHQHLETALTAYLQKLAPETGESLPTRSASTPKPPN